jgi:hypothetical protein
MIATSFHVLPIDRRIDRELAVRAEHRALAPHHLHVRRGMHHRTPTGAVETADSLITNPARYHPRSAGRRNEAARCAVRAAMR